MTFDEATEGAPTMSIFANKQDCLAARDRHFYEAGLREAAGVKDLVDGIIEVAPVFQGCGGYTRLALSVSETIKRVQQISTILAAIPSDHIADAAKMVAASGKTYDEGFKAGKDDGAQDFICWLIDHAECEMITEGFLQREYADYRNFIKAAATPASPPNIGEGEQCEWGKPYMYHREMVQDTTCGKCVERSDDDMKFCPYCGKPIKTV